MQYFPSLYRLIKDCDCSEVLSILSEKYLGAKDTAFCSLLRDLCTYPIYYQAEYILVADNKDKFSLSLYNLTTGKYQKCDCHLETLVNCELVLKNSSVKKEYPTKEFLLAAILDEVFKIWETRCNE